jgi:hypothetical protein
MMHGASFLPLRCAVYPTSSMARNIISIWVCLVDGVPESFLLYIVRASTLFP